MTLQGGDDNCIYDTSKLRIAPCSVDFIAENDGFIQSMNSTAIGITSVLLGAGRTKADDKLDHGAGIVLKKKTGDRVRKGECIATFYASDEKLFTDAFKKFKSALIIGKDETKINKTVLATVE